ncbi:TRAP transporter substrate-binding protein DctP [Pararhodobacter sp.]|uniref:TRAP transporter substrate-binding protein DctP n=1 Tax=Pararhodobacter sp. TaxID=2127056 RepID=UPI002AFE8AF7|nr:TRAP transporter substrate-binding protein DctP [Pararhodobacter sp.]
MQHWKIYLAGLALSTVAGLAHADEVTLRASAFVPTSTTYGVPFQLYVDRVNETGAGLVQIRVVGGPEAIPANEQPNALTAGVLDIIATPPSYTKGQFVEADAQSLTNLSFAEQRESGAVDALSELAVERMNARYLTGYGTGVPFHIYLTEPISSLDDLSGQRLRGQTTYNLLFNALGIDSTAVAAPEVFTALERGVISGVGWAFWGLGDFGWDRLITTRVDPGFYNVIINVLINNDSYNRLSPEQQAILNDAAVWFEDYMVEWSAERTAQEYAAQEAAGVTAFDAGPELAELATRVYWEDLESLSPEIARLRPMLER